ncbi:MAG: hypothetical protein IKA87_08345, partial [Lentisphaeria bacterium]|nr:hypothetical protein [Lentisphaeria bacterium]
MNTLDTFISGISAAPGLAVTAALMLAAAFYGCGRLVMITAGKNNIAAFGVGTAVFMTFFSLL